jgi:hypothetical protein
MHLHRLEEIMAEEHGREIYNHRQITALLRRAMELQQTGASQNGGGLSLDEIRQIAADVGIAPYYIDTAAAEHSGSATGVLGGPAAHELGRVITGSVDDEAWEAMVREARHNFGQAGTVSQLGATREWTTSERELVSMHMAVTSRNGQTRIQLTERFEGAAGLYYFAGTAFSAIALSVLASLLPFSAGVEWGVGGGALLGTVATMRTMFGRWSRRQGNKVGELMDRLEGMVHKESTAPDGSTAHNGQMRIAERSE